LHTLGWNDSEPVEEWEKTKDCSYAELRRIYEKYNTRIHQLEIDNSKVHLEGRLELLTSRITAFRAWVLGFCPTGTMSSSATDEELRACMTFVPATEHERVAQALAGWRSWARDLCKGAKDKFGSFVPIAGVEDDELRALVLEQHQHAVSDALDKQLRAFVSKFAEVRQGFEHLSP